MKEKMLGIAPGLKISASDYANQANAILGIREAGKTYTAMKAAEELLECEIPIIVFDPVGVWKNLKIGSGTHKGYPIVVAGGQGSDIILTKENAVDIVRAAMKENVSLVIDLYSPELINKSTWITIVQSVVDILMYENKAYGLRHIFIEEAAEFIPQKLQPQHGKVYASLERLARMGRNAKLGMTIINQRAEEVNKAILEICELCFIHRQVGKNSMLSIQKWFEVRQLENVKEIIKSLPLLNKGECWAVGLGEHPQRIQVSRKNTYHPDPKAKGKNEDLITTLARDVSGFVSKMNERLSKKIEERQSKKPQRHVAPSINNNQPLIDSLRGEIALLKEQKKIQQDVTRYWEKQAMSFRDTLYRIQKLIPEMGVIGPENAGIQMAPDANKLMQEAKKVAPKATQPLVRQISPVNGSLGKCSREVLRFLSQYREKEFTKAQIAIATGYSAGSGGFNNALSELNTKGWIIRSGKIKVNSDALPQIEEELGGSIEPVDYDINTYKEKLGKCEREIYEVLLTNPDQYFTKDEIASQTETPYSTGSGGFNNALSRMNTLELIERKNGQIRLNPELLELI